MGSRVDDLAQQIEDHRATIGAKVEHLSGRMREDADTVSDDVRQRVPEQLDLARYMRERPMTTLLGALGVGTVLGMLSEAVPMPGGGGGDERGGRPRPEGQRQQQGGGGMSSIIASAMAPLSGALQQQVQSLGEQVLGGFSERERRAPQPEEAAAGNGRES